MSDSSQTLSSHLDPFASALRGFSGDLARLGLPVGNPEGSVADLPQEVCEKLIAHAHARLGEVWPELDVSLYRQFTQNGNRVSFETPYFTRRRILNDLILGEVAEGSGRFIAKIKVGLRLICAEEGWQLPAHNRYARGGEILPEPDPQRPVIDLFAAETAAQLSTALELLGSWIDPELAAHIDAAVKQRVITPYLKTQFWWMGFEGGTMNNWTVWCTQNVLIAASLREAHAVQMPEILGRACFSLDRFWNEYGDDGGCPEGPFYYGHAALCLFTCAELLNAITLGAFDALLSSPKMRNIAEYILCAHIGGDAYANFGDAPAHMNHNDARILRFARALGSQDLLNHAVEVGHFGDSASDLSLYDRFHALLAGQRSKSSKKANAPKREAYLPSTGLFVARDERFYVAANAGHNGVDHNHNDLGSVITYLDGAPVLIDLGVETYTAKTFSPERYDIWTMQSAFHNLPSFDGAMQMAGEAYRAMSVETSFGSEEAKIEMDLTKAYSQDAQLGKFVRQVVLKRREKLTIADQYDGATNVVSHLMFAQMPVVSGTHSIAFESGANIHVSGAQEIFIEKIEINDARLQQSWPGPVFRALIVLANDQLTFEITGEAA